MNWVVVASLVVAATLGAAGVATWIVMVAAAVITTRPRRDQLAAAKAAREAALDANDPEHAEQLARTINAIKRDREAENIAALRDIIESARRAREKKAGLHRRYT